MNTQMTLLNRTLDLVRYPAHLQHQSWQAWDAADELIIQYVEETIPDYSQQKIAIFNDDFGALGCWFSHACVQWVSDSYVARRSMMDNLASNELSTSSVEALDSLAPLRETPDLVLIKIPKTLALLEHQLCSLQSVVSTKTRIVASGKVKTIHKSVLALFDKYLGTTTTSLAQKKARLIFCQPDNITHKPNPYPSLWPLEPEGYTVVNHANVFSRQQLDIGARFFLDNLPDCQGKHVLDLGCGNGVLGLMVLSEYQDSNVVFVDESWMAVESARETISRNMPEALSRCAFLHSNCLDEFDKLPSRVRPDVVLCNPPFHQQNAITDHIAFQMFKDARYRLNKGGELRIIGNRHLDYPQKLKRLFGGYSVVSSNRKFSILSAINR